MSERERESKEQLTLALKAHYFIALGRKEEEQRRARLGYLVKGDTSIDREREMEVS